jgi:asparagine synthase
LNPHGVQELLARNALLAPTTMFAGLRRVDVGGHVRYRGGTLDHGEHWNKYEQEADYRSVREAAEAAAAVVVDRVARYAAVAGGPVVCDLTGGLDSRLIASAADAAGSKPAVTVNGPPDREDVRIAHQVAGAMRWDMKYFNTPLLWGAEITPDMRRELLYRTNGELPFTEAYHHLLSRPQLAQGFDLHMIGSGGELLRYKPWSQEFFGIGRRRLASVNRLLDYRFFDVAPPPSLFSRNWLPALRSRLGARIEAICREQPGTRTTQQLDAVYVWKRTNHESLYISAVHDWLPSVAPLLSAGVVKAAVSMPWKMRLTSQLQRRMIHATSPRAAGAAATVYGATAEPTSFKNAHLEAWQSAKRAAHLFDKLDRTLFGGRLAKRSPSRGAALEEHKLFLMHQAERLLAPESMLSRALYTTEGLRRTVGGSDEDRQARYSVIMRLATVEALCRELGFEPEEDFLTTAPMEQAL